MIRQALLLAALPALMVAEVVPPADEAAQEPSFLAFRSRLLQAAADKDFGFVERLITPNTKLSFGGDDGQEGFRAIWAKQREKLFETLQETLRLGGRLERREGHDEFTAPYVYTDFPYDLDSFAFELAIVPSLRVRKQASVKSRSVDILRYETVEMIGNDYGQEWRKVRTPRGVVGYVADRYIRSPIDFRILFSNASGEWKIVFFVAGD